MKAKRIQIEKSASFVQMESLWTDVVRKFSVKENRDANNVAVRAAFSKLMRDTGEFTFLDIGCVLNRDHSAVINLVKKVNIGHYDSLEPYRKAVIYISDKIPSIYKDEEEKPKRFNFDTAVSLLERDKKILSIKNSKLTRVNEEIIAKAKKMKDAWEKISTEIYRNNVLVESLGYTPIKKELVDSVGESIRLINKVVL